ncbi:MAG: tol-pal system-associated acyl-CoA thioesterase [Pseudomonadota bacterium]|nr:tol-pal system-associated acyl-CoA thioesterase [Pseudomonadota bacterium]
MRVVARADPAQSSEAFRLPIRVYWEDTDAAGIVFYANYLKFFERARSEWLRGLGFGQERLRAESGIGFVVTETSLRYRAPARLDDVLDVTVRVDHLGQASLAVAQQAWRAGHLLAEGSIRVGCVELATFRPRRIPDAILTKINTPSR